MIEVEMIELLRPLLYVIRRDMSKKYMVFPRQIKYPYKPMIPISSITPTPQHHNLDNIDHNLFNHSRRLHEMNKMHFHK